MRIEKLIRYINIYVKLCRNLRKYMYIYTGICIHSYIYIYTHMQVLRIEHIIHGYYIRHWTFTFCRLWPNETKLNISWFKISIWLCLTEFLCTFETHLNLDGGNTTTNQPAQNVMLCGLLFHDSVEWHWRFIIYNLLIYDLASRHNPILTFRSNVLPSSSVNNKS